MRTWKQCSTRFDRTVGLPQTHLWGERMRVEITKIVVVSVIVGLIGYDVICPSIGQPTESMVLRNWARDWSLLPFCAGILTAHWFAPQRQIDISGWMWNLPIMGILIGTDIGWNLWGNSIHTDLTYPWWRFPFWYFLMGLPCGYFLWDQAAGWSPLP